MGTITLGQDALAEVNLVITQGSTNRYSFRYSAGTDNPVPVDLTGWTARMQIRRGLNSVSSWVTLGDHDEIELTADGLVTVTLPYDVTETDAWNDRDNGVWDLELTSPADERVRLVQGKVRVSHDVTRGG